MAIEDEYQEDPNGQGYVRQMLHGRAKERGGRGGGRRGSRMRRRRLEVLESVVGGGVGEGRRKFEKVVSDEKSQGEIQE